MAVDEPNEAQAADEKPSENQVVSSVFVDKKSVILFDFDGVISQENPSTEYPHQHTYTNPNDELAGLAITFYDSQQQQLFFEILATNNVLVLNGSQRCVVRGHANEFYALTYTDMQAALDEAFGQERDFLRKDIAEYMVGEGEQRITVDTTDGTKKPYVDYVRQYVLDNIPVTLVDDKTIYGNDLKLENNNHFIHCDPHQGGLIPLLPQIILQHLSLAEVLQALKNNAADDETKIRFCLNLIEYYKKIISSEIESSSYTAEEKQQILMELKYLCLKLQDSSCTVNDYMATLRAVTDIHAMVSLSIRLKELKKDTLSEEQASTYGAKIDLAASSARQNISAVCQPEVRSSLSRLLYGALALVLATVAVIATMTGIGNILHPWLAMAAKSVHACYIAAGVSSAAAVKAGLVATSAVSATSIATVERDESMLVEHSNYLHGALTKPLRNK